jgi:hypothetical protein
MPARSPILWIVAFGGSAVPSPAAQAPPGCAAGLSGAAQEPQRLPDAHTLRARELLADARTTPSCSRSGAASQTC